MNKLLYEIIIKINQIDSVYKKFYKMSKCNTVLNEYTTDIKQVKYIR